MPKFKTASDLFCQEGDSLGGEQKMDMAILLKDTWPLIKETDYGISLQTGSFGDRWSDQCIKFKSHFVLQLT